MDLKNKLLGKFYKLEVIDGNGDFYKLIEKVYHIDNLAGFAIKLSNNIFTGNEKTETSNTVSNENDSLVFVSYQKAMELTKEEGK